MKKDIDTSNKNQITCGKKLSNKFTVNLAAHESETSNKLNHYIPINVPFLILLV